MSKRVEKVLSINDLGINGAHQAGMLIPKKKEILEFFPRLNQDLKNPRVTIQFEDDLGAIWSFNFIYYNNKFWGGTRNEYRLTGMTSFFRSASLQPQDTVILSHDVDGYKIGYRKMGEANYYEDDDVVHISLGNSWTIINI